VLVFTLVVSDDKMRRNDSLRNKDGFPRDFSTSAEIDPPFSSRSGHENPFSSRLSILDLNGPWLLDTGHASTSADHDDVFVVWILFSIPGRACGRIQPGTEFKTAAQLPFPEREI